MALHRDSGARIRFAESHQRIASSGRFGPPSLAFTILGGLTLPSCPGQTEACALSLPAAPSLRALALYQPTRYWGFGLAGQVAAVHWKATYVSFGSSLTPQTVEANLTTGFLGAAVRYTPFPSWWATPMVELVMGGGLQEHGSNYGCHGGLTPTAQLGLGASAPLAPSVTFIAIASATGQLGATDCIVSDGPPATPLVGGGLGLHAGLTFDLGLASRSPRLAIARQ